MNKSRSRTLPRDDCHLSRNGLWRRDCLRWVWMGWLTLGRRAPSWVTPCGRDHRYFPCDDPDYDSMADDVYEYEREEGLRQWDNHYKDSLNWYISECDKDR